MTRTVADVMLERLRDWGVDHVFGYAGDGINGLLPAWDRKLVTSRGSCRRGTRRWRPSRRSATPSSPAASASVRRRVDPAAIHLLNGLYDAKLDHVPVVAIVGQTARSALGRTYQQEIDL